MLISSPKACLPITRPIIRKFMSGSILGSRSNPSAPNPLSGLTSSRGIKLRNNTRTKEFDDNSSERQLAEHEEESSGDTYFETYAERGGYNNTVISSADKVPNSNTGSSGTYGIQVKNETNVRYESI